MAKRINNVPFFQSGINAYFFRVYWYRGVTDNGNTAGLGYLEVNVICPCNLPIGGLASTVDPLTLTLTTTTSMQLQYKQASRPLHFRQHTTPKQLYVKMYWSQYHTVK
jgi:hypothetical protein